MNLLSRKKMNKIEVLFLMFGSRIVGSVSAIQTCPMMGLATFSRDSNFCESTLEIHGVHDRATYATLKRIASK